MNWRTRRLSRANKLLPAVKQPASISCRVERIDDAIVQMSEMVDALLGLVRYERNRTMHRRAGSPSNGITSKNSLGKREASRNSLTDSIRTNHPSHQYYHEYVGRQLIEKCDCCNFNSGKIVTITFPKIPCD
ncbi:hypothetical protein O9929_11360 [Vibrio lentus]|nr:hypothetical protein [Vibrio lentus]